MTNCTNCGARWHAHQCDYCGTPQSSGSTIVYNPRYIDPVDFDKPLIPVRKLANDMRMTYAITFGQHLNRYA